MKVEIGLKSAKEGYRPDGSDEIAYRPVEGLRVLTADIPDNVTTGEAFRTLTDATGVVSYHSDEPPAWVACDEKPALADLLAEHFACEKGKPADVEATHWTEAGPPGVDGTEQPATEQPPTEQPATEQPAAEQPATEQPATEQSVEAPATDQTQPAAAPTFDPTAPA